MPSTLNVHEAKTHFSKLLDRAHAGEEIIIAKAGKPYARLVKIEDAPPFKRVPGGWPELANVPDEVWLAPMSDDDLDAWEGKYSNIV